VLLVKMRIGPRRICKDAFVRASYWTVPLEAGIPTSAARQKAPSPRAIRELGLRKRVVLKQRLA
jgi:hypothetical protein